MRRIISVWLPRWPTDRLRRDFRRQTTNASPPPDAPDFTQPFALVASTSGGYRLTACNEAASEEGLSAGQLATDARALCRELQLREAEPEKDAAALRSLATWATRYTPFIAPCTGANGIDGLLLDVTGCAHLFGGEEALLKDLANRLHGFGFALRLAMAGTVGAAWALARFGKRDITLVVPEAEPEALGPLPIAALRIPDNVEEGLVQVGLKRVHDLARVARAPITTRFGPAALMRLDQALGRADEPVTPQISTPPVRSDMRVFDPLVTPDGIGEAIDQLCAGVETQLLAKGRGARVLLLSLFRVDGDVATLDVGTARAEARGSRLAKLFKERLDRLATDIDFGFGFEAAALEVLRSDTLATSQNDLEADHRFEGDFSAFVDRAGNRFGWKAVRVLGTQQSHIPERAVTAMPAHVGPPPLEWVEEQSRPMAMLPCAEPIEVLAEVPEGPPRQFKWRRVAYRVARAEGPERIAPEWWREDQARARTRDYYRIEDDAGRRFWLYREGLYGREAAAPRWYMHGLLS